MLIIYKWLSEPCIHSSAHGSAHEDDPAQEQVRNSAHGHDNQDTGQDRSTHIHYPA